jgi:hypothetical protein
MKKHIEVRKFIIITGLLLVFAGSLFASGEPDTEKRKTYTKSYTLGSNDKVSIDNQFGEVKIITWSKAEVQTDVTIIARGNSEEKAQEILDHINIEDGKNSEGVYFKTNMKNHNSKGKGEHNQKMEINYEVHMPAGNPLDLENSFGSTNVPDMTGPVELTQKFGDLVAGNLSNAKEIRVEFGSIAVENVSNSKMVIKFSKAEIKKMSGNIKLSLEYCDKVKLHLDNTVTDLNINNSFSDIQIAVANGFSGDFDIHTSFSDLKNEEVLGIKEEKQEDEHGPKFDKDYTGKTGSGANKVKIKSSFGKIKFI